MDIIPETRDAVVTQTTELVVMTTLYRFSDQITAILSQNFLCTTIYISCQARLQVCLYLCGIMFFLHLLTLIYNKNADLNMEIISC